MKNYTKYQAFIGTFLISLILLSSCSDYLNPDQDINITEKQLYSDWYEYRSIEMGLYSLQSKLVEQIVILGELRADLLQVTENADADMVEIYNFNISKENKYASPTNFFKLISACNKFITVLKREHPDVIDMAKPANNYDRLYSEALCMRAWAYFNAVRIYGKVPFIPESLTSIEEIDGFVNSTGTYIDSVYINYAIGGYYNDTIYNKPIELNKQYFDIHLIIDYFTNELENKIKRDGEGGFVVGVNHYMDNNDQTWEVSIWNRYALHTLLGIMYLTDGDLSKAATNFEKVLVFDTQNNRYQLTSSTGYGNWKNSFSAINLNEHILAIWFDQAYAQQNDLQKIFDFRSPHKYMLKPTKSAVLNWETIWDNPNYSLNSFDPNKSKTIYRGNPGDFFRGYSASYGYFRNGNSLISVTDVRNMLEAKAEGEYRSLETIMDGTDTVVWKFSVNHSVFEQDAIFPIFRAGGVQLWLAEVYAYLESLQNGIVVSRSSIALEIINDGTFYSKSRNRVQLGVRGRVGFADNQEKIYIGNIIYKHDPFTNQIIGYDNFGNNALGQKQYLEEKIMEERARELAFEGQRFYDLMRVAKRRNDPSYLAKMVSQKFPAHRREAIYNYLLNEDNWYINYFDE